MKDQSVQPEFLAWLDEQAKQGMEAHGANEVWNAAWEAATVRFADLEKQAARYQWLKARDFCIDKEITASNADAAIDAHMNAA